MEGVVFVYTEVLKIIEGGITGDREKVYNYAKVFADNLEKEGDLSFSKKVRGVLGSKNTKLTSLDEFATKPVDQESRMDMVDLDFPADQFDNIVLNKYVQEEFEEFIKTYQHRDELLKAGVDINSSLLLYGPPGCGKTTIARYISFKTGLPLVTARFDALVSSLLGSTAKNIRKVFDYASKRECILFLDEFDVIAKLRNDKNELGELKRVVNSLIQNIDDFNKNSILIAATNHHELLDPAIWRRFSKVISLDKPHQNEIELYIRNELNNTETNFSFEDKKDKKFKQIVATLDGLSYADIKTVLTNCIKKSVINKKMIVNNWDLLQEIYFFKHHNLNDENDFIKYLLINGVTHNDINKIYGVSLRTIRELSGKLKEV